MSFINLVVFRNNREHARYCTSSGSYMSTNRQDAVRFERTTDAMDFALGMLDIMREAIRIEIKREGATGLEDVGTVHQSHEVGPRKPHHYPLVIGGDAGCFTVSRNHGLVIEYLHNSDLLEEQSYLHVERVNLDAYRKALQVQSLDEFSRIDIVDIGLWLHDGTYVPPGVNHEGRLRPTFAPDVMRAMESAYHAPRNMVAKDLELMNWDAMTLPCERVGDSLLEFLLRELSEDGDPRNSDAHWSEALHRVKRIVEHIERVQRFMQYCVDKRAGNLTLQQISSVLPMPYESTAIELAASMALNLNPIVITQAQREEIPETELTSRIADLIGAWQQDAIVHCGSVDAYWKTLAERGDGVPLYDVAEELNARLVAEAIDEESSGDDRHFVARVRAKLTHTT